MSGSGSGWADAGLQFEVTEGVAWLRLNRPQKRNAIDRPLRNALLEAVAEVAENPDLRAGVVTGNGPVFCSGADLTQEGGAIEVPPGRRTGSMPNLVRRDGLLYGWWRLFKAIWEAEKPFLAAVNGGAVGFGCQLALACDLVIAAEDAYFWEVFVRRGLPLEGGGAWILPRLTSLARAKEIALFGDRLSAADAERYGLANRVVPAVEFDEVVAGWARRLAEGPTVRIGHIKQQLNRSLHSTMEDTFREEVTLLGLGGGEDSAEAMRAFAEGREPRFTGQ
jgi:2-(1,2-epoxy-1,2-dihydrophenyl)acetyl-CoA isomerase